ncbi:MULTISPECIES: hypothetical protein [Bacillus cereus group]|uniref:hypothetical protein n=1 Tax=Bacillus cereus group TaxID=86661 RepID=UPI000BEC7C69|nr:MULTISPECIES: hypothetical protein [Bacillus cereus group]PEF88577.1 hypothetical protein CON51_05070 [Bacillus thuringiensis]PES54754.1 hypothetical protein CN506_19870 [Bacillus thuringiensis]PFP03555.1 hypothetical protein COJ91_22455 [Bacillus thuringiensis]PFS55710.1 hypothetical protein COK64_23480 [Bacillus thuringiensis]PGL62362.1 hypothetical protein CN939_19645 [Bacillus thuringiensis]
MAKEQTEFKYWGRDSDNMQIMIDNDNDLEIIVKEVDIDFAYIYVNDEKMKEFRKGIKRVLKGESDEYSFTCNEDWDDKLVFRCSDFYKGYMNVFTEGSSEVFTRFSFEDIKKLTKDLKSLRKIMKRDAE